jgi:RNA polymerase sigma-54 factor
MKQALEQRMSQSLVMTQQLQQSIRLLQYSAAELVEFVEAEIEKNPLLAADDSENDQPSTSSSDEASDDAGVSRSDAMDALVSAERDDVDVSERDSIELGRDNDISRALDTDEEAVWGGGDGDMSSGFDADGFAESYAVSGGNESGGSGGGGEDGAGFLSDSIEQRHSVDITLREHVLEQVMLDFTDAAQRIIASYVVDMLDDYGYLREDSTSIAAQLGTTFDAIEAVVMKLQACDPIGVAARNLAECLALQLKERDRYDPAMQRLIENLELVAEGNRKALMRICQVDEEDLRDMLAELKRLNPYPASAFMKLQAEPVIPDVILRRSDKAWRVELNHDVLPKVLINKEYYNTLQRGSREKDDKKYVAEQLANAHWLMRALDQRAQTLLKVSTEIVKQQEGFFEHGIHHLKPLTLQDVATEIGVHESSVSRVTTNKYISTPRGTFELKYFFSSSISASKGGDDFSSRSVQQMIKDMIDREKPDDVLSDDTIAEALQRRGVDVARRTVVKYRTALHIPSSIERRRLKRNGF